VVRGAFRWGEVGGCEDDAPCVQKGVGARSEGSRDGAQAEKRGARRVVNNPIEEVRVGRGVD
jgi:hypothetical protein